MFEVMVDTSKALAYFQTLESSLTNKEIYDEVGKAGVKIIQELLKPLRRTGYTAESFSYRIQNDSVIIYSDEDSANYLATGFRQAPNTDELREWMKHKSEFSGLNEKEATRVAFAIRKAIIANNPPGPNSDLARLQPVGERKYDYIKLATDQIIDMINQKMNDYFL